MEDRSLLWIGKINRNGNYNYEKNFVVSTGIGGSVVLGAVDAGAVAMFQSVPVVLPKSGDPVHDAPLPQSGGRPGAEVFGVAEADQAVSAWAASDAMRMSKSCWILVSKSITFSPGG